MLATVILTQQIIITSNGDDLVRTKTMTSKLVKLLDKFLESPMENYFFKVQLVYFYLSFVKADVIQFSLVANCFENAYL